MGGWNPVFRFVHGVLIGARTASYRADEQVNVDSFLDAEVYNLFIVATILCLFICVISVAASYLGFFRIALKERHIRELASHLVSNNAIVFETLGTDVDILKQFTTEHLMKYLEYNSGSEPIPIEQIRVPFFLNRDSIKMTVRHTSLF